MADRTTRALFSFRDSAIVESSGIVSSSYSDRLVHTHNDSGDTARFFAVDFRGCTLARFNVSDASATDWEDMAHSTGPSGTPTLWFGDIGDNGYSRPTIQVYRVTEPHLTPHGSGACPKPLERRIKGARYALMYPDGSHDAETLMADPGTGRLYIVTKAESHGEVPTLYSAPLPLRSGSMNIMHKVEQVRSASGRCTTETSPPPWPVNRGTSACPHSHKARRSATRGPATTYSSRPRTRRTARRRSTSSRLIPEAPGRKGVAAANLGRSLDA